MTETGAKPRRRGLWRYLLYLVLAGLLFLAGLTWYATTDSFQSFVRRRLVAELERITGGKVELGSIHTVPFLFQVEVRNLTIHGREDVSDVPYAHIDSLVAQIKIISAFSAEFGFKSLVLEHPVIHLIFYPDGTTNQPEPRLKKTSKQTPMEALFALSISRLDVRRGELLWNDQIIPLDFTANDVSADMSYSLFRRHYLVNLLVGKGETKFENYRPIAWTAAGHFTLGRDNVEISSLKATSGRSHFEMSGNLLSFRQPKIQGSYDATLDLAEASAVVRHPEIRRGVLQASGKGSWTMENFSAIGKLMLRDFEWHDDHVNLHGVVATSQFAVSQQRLALSQMEAKLLGGSVSGDAEVTDWASSHATTSREITKSSKRKSPPQQKGTVHLRVKDVSAAEVLAALSSPELPLSKMNIAGTNSGTIDTHWKGSPSDADTEIKMEVVAPQHPSASQLPLNAHAQAVYHVRTGEWEIDELSAATRSSQIHASGALAQTASLRLTASTSDLGEWQSLLNAFGTSAKIPATLHGQVTFKGTANGRPPDITLAGKLNVENFDLTIPATSRTTEKQVHWDSLDADVQFSQRSLVVRNGILHHNDTSVAFDGNTALYHWQITDDTEYTAHFNMHQAQVAEILSVVGYDLPITGAADFSMQLAGSPANSHGDGHVQIADAVVYGQPIQHLNSDINVNGQQISLHNIDLVHADARITGGADYDFSTRAFHSNLNGENFNLADIPQLQKSRVLIEGRLDFTARGSGTIEAPAIDASVHLRNLTLDHELAGDFNLDGSTHGPDLHVRGHSQFQNSDLTVEGNIRLRDDWPATLDARFNHLDMDSLLQAYAKGRITGHSAVSGEVRLEGALRHPRDLNITGNLGELSADIENLKVRNDGPVRFAMSNEKLRIDQLHLIGDNTDLSASGSVQLTGDQELNFHAQGKINLQLIQTFNPDFISSGVVTVDASVAGTPSRPSIQGRLEFANGSIAYSDLPSALSDINGALTFNQNRLQIESLTARTGGGLVTFSGSATAYNRQLTFDLSVKGDGVRLRYPPGISSTANADVRFAGSSSASTLSGDITINKLSVTPGFNFGASLDRTAQAATLPQTNPLLNRIRLDVHIVTAPELQMQSAVLRFSGDADLHLRGTAAKPVLLGRADVIEGEAYFNGTKYRLERGEVLFTNPVATTPVLDLQASTQVRDYDITLTLNGKIDTSDSLKISYRSEPPLPTNDIIALLAFGQTTQESGQLQQSGQTGLGQGASSALLAAALNATVSNRVQRLFGVSRITIDPQGLNTATSTTQSGPAVTIEQQISDKFSMSYSTNISQTSQQVIQAEYNVTRNVSIVAIRDQNGVVSFDVRIRQRKK